MRKSWNEQNHNGDGAIAVMERGMADRGRDKEMNNPEEKQTILHRDIHLRAVWQKLAAFVHRHHRLVLFLSIVLLTLLAWQRRFIVDDAFISFRYADNLVQGHGLVYNPGEYVEGYTNFLWTVLMALPILVGQEPVVFSWVLGTAGFLVSLILCYRLGIHVLRSRTWALLAVLLVGTNFTFSIFATSGLETSLQSTLILAVFLLSFASLSSERITMRVALAVSLLTSAAILTRLDSALLLLIPYVLLLLQAVRQPASSHHRLITLIALFLPFTLIVGGWMLWKYGYYGVLLPNTFSVRIVDFESVERGWSYVRMFFFTYLLPVFAALVPFSFVPAIAAFRARRISLVIPILVLPVVLWLGYVITVGGDWMEFRFFVPVVIPMFLVLLLAIRSFIRDATARVILPLMLSFGTVFHQTTFISQPSGNYPITYKEMVESIPQRHTDVVGRALGDALGHNPSVTIASPHAGNIPFYSRLRTVDMYGLTDAWTAQNGDFDFAAGAGHQRRTTLQHLIDRRVNFIIHPNFVTGPVIQKVLETRAQSILEFFRLSRPRQAFPEDARFVYIPLNESMTLAVLYLVHTPELDALILERGWRQQLIPQQPALRSLKPVSEVVL